MGDFVLSNSQGKLLPDDTDWPNPPWDQSPSRAGFVRIALPALVGLVTGLGVWVAIISEAHSYLGEAPETCVNCHVMRSAYASWFHSSHREAATCNDCHVPHESPLEHWLFKAQDGLRHAAIFTLGWEPEVIHLSERAKPVVENNCRRCHGQVLHEVSLSSFDPQAAGCWDCHPSPHAQPHSQSSFGLWIEGP